MRINLLGRRSQRQPMRVSVLLRPKTQRYSRPSKASSLDWSKHGIRVRNGVHLVPGEDVILVANRLLPQAMHCRVVWVGSPELRNEGQIGLEFLGPAPQA
jgi:PilZ domain-containing protein